MGDATHNQSALLDVNYRERTFSTRPRDFNERLKSRDLAEAGFFLSTERDVKCYTCGIELNCGLFNDLSDVMKFHGEMRPDCERSKHFSSSTSSPHRLCNNDAVNVCHSIPSTLPGSSTPNAAIASSSASGSIDASTSNTTPIRNVECKGFNTFDSLRYERERLSTFIDWPLPWLTPETLAKEGFYYLRDNDFVSCVFCRGIVGAWEQGDIPSQEHKRHFPKCSFVRCQPVGNVPIAQGDLLASLPAVGPCEPPPAAESRTPSFECKVHSKGKQCNLQCKLNSLSSKESSSDPLESLPEYSGPKRKEYLTKDSREKSYKNWPKKVKQTPQALAEAGFYYCGLSDHVRCFHCGNGLRNWEADDSPWVEHARWYPSCNFVLLQKGIEFVDHVRQVNPPYFRHQEFSSSPSHSPSSKAGSPSDLNSNYRVHITEPQLDVLMELDIQKSVLGMGFSPRAVRKALRQKIEETGVPFFNLETCIEKVLTCVEQMETEVEAERKQDTKLMAYQREREERIRQSHEQSLLRAASASSVSNEPLGMDVVNTERRSPPRTDRASASAADGDAASTSRDQLRPSCTGCSNRTPIITSPVMPPRRENNLQRTSPRLDAGSSSSTLGSTALSSNINMQRSVTFRPVVRDGDATSLEGRPDFQPVAVSSPSFQNERSSSTGSGSDETAMESEDIIEFPLGRRHRREAGDEITAMDTTSTPPTGDTDQDRDITPTNDHFNTTSTPRTSPSGSRMFASTAPAGTFTAGGSNWTPSSPSTSSELHSQSSLASTSSATAPDPVSQEMISQVDKVITLAEKEQKRVCRHLSNSSTKSTGGCSISSAASSTDGESGLDESSMSDGDDSMEEQLTAAKKEVSELKDQMDRLRESRLCKICMDAELSVMLLPCTHMATCVTCTLALATCPICRTDIKHVIKPNIVA